MCVITGRVGFCPPPLQDAGVFILHRNQVRGLRVHLWTRLFFFFLFPPSSPVLFWSPWTRSAFIYMLAVPRL